ncbi:unnamed protein product [Lactuca virosa]|uniref:YDG domain-containing protein n=1 Tax=Lactuca virosa TaxID=75947 RepID=A0AAU9MZ71_9ASTR|nr:unnamed protein product [Lactuca virosa]
MAFPEKIPQPVISTKRSLGDSDDCKLDEFRKPKMVMRKYPPHKIRGAEAVRDFPPGCGILQDSLASNVEKKPLKKLDNVESDIENVTSHGKDKMVNSKPFEDNKLNRCIKPLGLGFKKPSFGTRPFDKVKFLNPMEQHPVCGIIQERKPFKKLDNVDSKSMECCHPLESTKPKESGINNKLFGSRPTGKVKYWDPRIPSTNDNNAPKSNTIGSQNEQIRREKLRETMILFETIYTQLFQDNESKQKGEKRANWILPMEAAKILKQKLKWMNADKTLGQICGVQPGDMFRFRRQLHIVGLHCQPHCGIDYTNINGKNLAISIVDSHRYSNESQSCDVLTYCGEGGGGVGCFGSSRQVVPDDQKLERGNLALKNSMIEKNPVRVIRKVFGVGKNNNLFVYDGFYTVEHCTQKRSSEGTMVFRFQLHKIPGQPHFHQWVNAIPGNFVLYRYTTFQML